MGELLILRLYLDVGDDVATKAEKPDPQLLRGPQSGVAFDRRSKGRERGDSVGWEMVRLQVVGANPIPEEIAHRQTKSPLEVGQEHDELTRIG